MKIEKLEIRNFGKMQNRTLEFSDGIQLISGENESGKSTVHTFIRSMLFGMTRGRGRAAKNDVYSRYEPWENPAYYAGEMVLESGGKRFRLTRNFGRQNANAKLVCLTDGEVLSVEDETRPAYDLEQLKKTYGASLISAYIEAFETKTDAQSQKALDYGLEALLAARRNG